jgi:large conductance mechanosensitive channel
MVRVAVKSTDSFLFIHLKKTNSLGAVTLAWGAFVDNLVTFFALGGVLYGVAQIYSALTNESIIKHIVKCKYCRKDIGETVCLFI